MFPWSEYSPFIFTTNIVVEWIVRNIDVACFCFLKYNTVKKKIWLRDRFFLYSFVLNKTEIDLSITLSTKNQHFDTYTYGCPSIQRKTRRTHLKTYIKREINKVLPEDRNMKLVYTGPKHGTISNPILVGPLVRRSMVGRGKKYPSPNRYNTSNRPWRKSLNTIIN